MSSISVSNITLGNSCAFYQADTLTEATKRKLIELGIPVTKGMTETEAQQKIAKAESSQNSQNSQSQTGSNRDENSMDLLLIKIRQLAQDVGISVSHSDTATKILDNIKKHLTYLSGIINPEDKEATQALKDFKQRRYELKVELERIESSQERIFSAMDLVSQSNKIALGLQ